MAYSRNLDYRYVSNSRISSRGKQLLALAGAIIIGMIISATVNAIPGSKSAPVADRTTETVLSVK